MAKAGSSRNLSWAIVQVRAIGQLGATGNLRSENTVTFSGQSGSSIQEATGFALTPEGRVALVVDRSQPRSTTDLTCTQ